MPKKNKLTLSPALLAALFGAALVFVYAGNSIFPLVTGPALSVHEPRLMENGIVRIAGETRRVSKLIVNDLTVPITEAGVFSVERSYPPGYTVVVVKALDRFGREREQTLAFTNN